jgi:hypothetical protein
MPSECSNCADSDSVAGHRGPAVVEQLHVRRPRLIIGSMVKIIPGFNTGPVPAGAADMDDFGRVVEQAADAMAAEIAHHAIAVLARHALDRMRRYRPSVLPGFAAAMPSIRHS